MIDIREVLRTLQEDLKTPYGFHYVFNHPQTAVDADYWTAGGDAGGFTVVTADDEPASRKLYADTVQNNDYYIHGDTKYSKLWTFQAGEYSTIIFETKLKISSVTTDIQALFGLFEAGSFPTGYAEPAVDCAQFFIDDGISANFVCRTYDAAAEEQTASDVALDTSAHVFRMTLSSANVVFEIDGVVKATHSTTVPDSPMGIVYLVRTEEAAGAERSITPEYIKIEVEE